MIGETTKVYLGGVHVATFNDYMKQVVVGSQFFLGQLSYEVGAMTTDPQEARMEIYLRRKNQGDLFQDAFKLLVQLKPSLEIEFPIDDPVGVMDEVVGYVNAKFRLLSRWRARMARAIDPFRDPTLENLKERFIGESVRQQNAPGDSAIGQLLQSATDYSSALYRKIEAMEKSIAKGIPIGTGTEDLISFLEELIEDPAPSECWLNTVVRIRRWINILKEVDDVSSR